jgi:hypothetical protein
VSVGIGKNNSFTNTAKKYRSSDLFSISRSASAAEVQKMANALRDYDVVILGIFDGNNSPSKNYGIYQSTYDLANLITQNSKLIVDMHANPYAADRFLSSARASVLISYEDVPVCLEASAEALFGGSIINGKLPVSINDSLKQGFGLEVKKKD